MWALLSLIYCSIDVTCQENRKLESVIRNKIWTQLFIWHGMYSWKMKPELAVLIWINEWEILKVYSIHQKTAIKKIYTIAIHQIKVEINKKQVTILPLSKMCWNVTLYDE